MDFDLSWILLGLPLAFVLGWLASRFDLRQLRIENRRAPKAYFKGLNFLLNEQQDQAIDAFIEAVQNDPDTSELHFALGNLFRRRGEYERAVRVHEHLLSRGDLNLVDRQRAQHALALDYLKAGLLDRAETALIKLEGSPFEAQARLALLANYERSRDWLQAAQIAQKLAQSGQGNFDARLAHYLCEQAATCRANNDREQARHLLQEALETAPAAARPRIDLASLLASQEQAQAAFDTLKKSLELSPMSTPLIAAPLANYAQVIGQSAEALTLLKASYEQAPSLDVLDTIVSLEAALPTPSPTARDWYVRHLEREPSLVAAARSNAPSIRL
jgi:lipopolysaccharide biosynthesis regulator YciM